MHRNYLAGLGSNRKETLDLSFMYAEMYSRSAAKIRRFGYLKFIPWLTILCSEGIDDSTSTNDLGVPESLDGDSFGHFILFVDLDVGY